MLETYVTARDKFLKGKGGMMFPNLGSIIFSPITDDALYKEQLAKIEFWNCNNFYGVDLTKALERAYDEYFSQPVVGYFPVSALLSSNRVVHSVS
jgi:histone-arginine methyltransferase CARM1